MLRTTCRMINWQVMHEKRSNPNDGSQVISSQSSQHPALCTALPAPFLYSSPPKVEPHQQLDSPRFMFAMPNVNLIFNWTWRFQRTPAKRQKGEGASERGSLSVVGK